LRRKDLAVPKSNVRFGSQADICSATSDVRFAPNSDRKSRHELAAPTLS
jgi:hypothetical protein